MSWTGGELPVVEGWGDLWSTADASWLLDMPVRQVRDELRRAGIEAVGKRHDRGRGTRHVRVYLASDVLEALGMSCSPLSGSFYGP
jgi:hypothetical protein